MKIYLLILIMFFIPTCVCNANETSIRIIHGERPLSISEVMNLEEYRLNRQLYVRELKLHYEDQEIERTEEQRQRKMQRALKLMAEQDLKRQIAKMHSLHKVLDDEYNKYQRGEISEYHTLKDHVIKLTQLVSTIEIIKGAYKEVGELLTKELSIVEGMLQVFSEMQFNVSKPSGWIQRDMTLEDIHNDNTVSYKTLFAEAMQYRLEELDTKPQVRKAIIKFNKQVYELMSLQLVYYDEPFMPGAFTKSAGEVSRKQIEEALKLMDFLRSRFGLKQAFPKIFDRRPITGFFYINYATKSTMDALSRAPEYLNEMVEAHEDLNQLPAKLLRKRVEMRKWFLNHLIAQMKAELALRLEGADAAEVLQRCPQDDEILAVLHRPSNDIVDAFKQVLVTISTTITLNKLERPQNVQLSSWDDIINQ